jgi:hypothetical protein
MAADLWLRQEEIAGNHAVPTFRLESGRSRAHIPRMAKHHTVRLLEVTVTAQEPALWKWHISDGAVEVAYGYDTSRAAAQIDGDSALFALLSSPAS